MRTLEQCKAEIFRRSEEKINIRKQRRKHILVGCIPVILCISALSLIYFPGKFANKAGTPAETYENVNGSIVTSVAEVRVDGEKLQLSYTDPNQIFSICNILLPDGSMAGQNGISESTEIAPEGDTLQPTENTSGYVPDQNSETKAPERTDVTATYGSAIGYTITLVSHDGAEETYYLCGNTIRNTTTKHKYTLPQNKLEELIRLLGIPSITFP